MERFVGEVEEVLEGEEGDLVLRSASHRHMLSQQALKPVLGID